MNSSGFDRTFQTKNTLNSKAEILSESMVLEGVARSAENAPLVPPKRSHRNILLAAFSALTYIVAFGMVTSYSSPATVDMAKPGSRFRDITNEQITWIASLPALGGVVGNAVSGYLSHKLGRKACLMYVSFSFTVSWLAIAYAPDKGFVYTGRLVSGFCAGVCAVAVPAYVVEVSAIEIRGFLTAGFQTAFATGVLLVISLGTTLRWSWLAVAGAAFVVAGAGMMCFMPESPHWLIRMSRNAEAFHGLRFLRRQYHDAAMEFREITEHIAEEPRNGLTFNQLFKPELYKPIVIAAALMMFQQFAGINALMSYSYELFQNTKSFLSPSLSASLVALVQVLSTAISCLLVDKAGRRILYITSGIFMTFSLCISGVYSFFYEKDPQQMAAYWNWVPLASFVAYIAAFSLGFGPIPFVVTPEMVPTHSRSFLLAFASVSSNFFSFVATKTFDDMRSRLGLSGLYWTYGTFAFLGSCFYWLFIPETKGRTIRDIHRQFSVSNTNTEPSTSSSQK